MKLTKHSERNLLVIENFIDNYTSNEDEREQMKQVALSYVLEDHVDGEQSPEAQIEKNTYKFISTDVELNEPDCEENTFNVSIIIDNNQYYFKAKENCDNGRTFYYELVEPYNVIKNNPIARHEILTYCLGKYTKDDEVTLIDIFMHKKYTKKLRAIGENFN